MKIHFNVLYLFYFMDLNKGSEWPYGLVPNSVRKIIRYILHNVCVTLFTSITFKLHISIFSPALF
jgi:hypothetical protein